MKVEILPTAWACLQQIRWNVYERFGKEVAEKVTDKILDSIERLETYPDSGTMTPDPWLNREGYRMVVANKHNVSIFRKVDDTVYVYFIADTRMDYPKLFRSTINPE